MTMHSRLVIKLLAVAACGTAACSAAQAADNTRYISITGSNANACTLAAPCRTLQRGVNMTPAGGVLQILDSGSYGSNATIRKSLTISGNDHTVYLGRPITIDKAGAVVALRQLVLNGQGAISGGVSIVAATAVHIERCVIHGFTEDGIEATAAGAEMFLLDSASRDNGGRGFLFSASDSRVTIDQSRFDNNGGDGLDVRGGHVKISRSIVSGNSDGIIMLQGVTVSILSSSFVHNTSGGLLLIDEGTNATVESSVAHGNGGTGLRTNPRTIARISNSTFTNNATGISNAGTVETLRNNTAIGNTVDASGNPLTPINGS